jgi:hypothetical protein
MQNLSGYGLTIFWPDGLCIELSPIGACPRVGARPSTPLIVLHPLIYLHSRNKQIEFYFIVNLAAATSFYTRVSARPPILLI